MLDPHRALFIVCVTAFFTVGCSGMFAAPRPAGTPDDADCMMGAGGGVTCGYHCMMGADGVVNCADTKDGSCQMEIGGSIACTQMAPPPAAASSDTTSTGGTEESTPLPDVETSPEAGSTSSSSAYCCVNRAYYECPGAAEAAVCLGEPMDLMSCVQNCPMMGSGGCEEECIRTHGPRPEESGCTRTPARDGECPAN